MSWHYLPGLEEALSEVISSGGEPSPLSSKNPIAGKSCSGGKGTVCSHCSQSGTMREHSMERRGEAGYLSSVPGSHALRSRLPANELLNSMTEICGPIPSGSLAKWHRPSSSWRMFQGWLLTDISEELLETWFPAGTIRNGYVSERMTVARHIAGNGSGFSQLPEISDPAQSSDRLWRTPDTGGGGPQAKLGMGLTVRESGESIQIRLADQVKHRHLWPNASARQEASPVMWLTPRATEVAENPESFVKRNGDRKEGNHASLSAQVKWPTPTLGDSRASGSRNTETSRAHPGISLTDAIREDGGKGRGEAPQIKWPREMWPTPSANEDAAGRPGAKMQKMLGNDPRLGKPRSQMAERESHGGTKTRQIFPTPQARDQNTYAKTKRGAGSPGGTPLTVMAAEMDGPVVEPKGLALNPMWVEWLMGWPIGWTDSKPLAMGKFQQWLFKHGIS